MAVTNPTTAAPKVSGSPHDGLLRLSFRFQSAGADTTAPDFQIPPGVLLSAASAATGLYTLTLVAAYRNFPLVSCQACTLAATSETTAQTLNVVSYVASTGVLVLQGKDTSADPADAYIANNEWGMVDMVLSQDPAVGTAGAIPAA
jgi:hypothetical protein